MKEERVEERKAAKQQVTSIGSTAHLPLPPPPYLLPLWPLPDVTCRPLSAELVQLISPRRLILPRERVEGYHGRGRDTMEGQDCNLVPALLKNLAALLVDAINDSCPTGAITFPRNRCLMSVHRICFPAAPVPGASRQRGEGACGAEAAT